MSTASTLTNLVPRDLHDLACAIAQRDPGHRAVAQLTPEGIDRLADILLAGSLPTIGFWRRYRRTAP